MRLSVNNVIQWLPGNSRVELSSWLRYYQGGRKGYPIEGEPKGKANFIGGKEPEAHLVTLDKADFLNEACLFYWRWERDGAQPGQDRCWLSWPSKYQVLQQPESPDTEVMQIPVGEKEIKKFSIPTPGLLAYAYGNVIVRKGRMTAVVYLHPIRTFYSFSNST